MALLNRETLQGVGLGFLGGYVDSLGFVALFGLFSAQAGYPAGFALTGVLVLAALPAALREGRAGATV